MRGEGPVRPDERKRSAANVGVGLLAALGVFVALAVTGVLGEAQPATLAVFALAVVVALVFTFAFPRLQQRRQRERMPFFRSR